jgi:type I restriction enzyme, S subunit
MTTLPNGWKLAELNDLQSEEPRAITDGPFGSNLARVHYTASGPRVVRLQNIGDGVFNDARAHISEAHFQTLRTHEVLPGDLLVASLGEVLPRACLAPASLGPAIVKADCIRVRLSPDVDPRWVMYSLQRPQVRRWADDHRHGVGRPRLGLRVIRQLPVPLPPLDEQRRIVDILEDHLSRLDAAESGIAFSVARLTCLKERVLSAGLLGERMPGPREQSDLTGCGTDDGQLPDLPVGWTWRRLGDIATVVGGVTKDSKRQSDPAFVEVPYLSVANVQRGWLDLGKVTNIRVPASKAESLRLLSGDVLMNEGGDRDKLARGWVWEGQVEDCIHQNHVFRARVVDGAIEPKLLSWAGNTIGGRWAERNGKQSVNLASISLTKIRQMPVPVPPKAVQPELVKQLEDRLEACDRLTANLHEALARSAALRRSLLASAFSGLLTTRNDDIETVEEMAGV